jgi:hypothetical protein
MNSIQNHSRALYESETINPESKLLPPPSSGNGNQLGPDPSRIAKADRYGQQTVYQRYIQAKIQDNTLVYDQWWRDAATRAAISWSDAYKRAWYRAN